MIGGVTGIGQMSGVTGVMPYGAYQYGAASRIRAVSHGTDGRTGQSAASSATVQADTGAGRSSQAASSVAGTGAAAQGSSITASGIGRSGVVMAGRGANPEMPVEPVSPIGVIGTGSTRSAAIPFLREGMDPAELAVRMRIQYANPSDAGAAGVKMPGGKTQESADAMRMPGEKAQEGIDAVRMPGETAARGVVGTQGGRQPEGADGIRVPGEQDGKIPGVQETAEDGECQTCKERKYQDGSDDSGVSYQTPTHIDPDRAASAVRGHEMEHVVRERASAEREDRRVVSQSVTMHTSICPECGKVYVSGGTTRTTTAANPEPVQSEMPTGQQFARGFSIAA